MTTIFEKATRVKLRFATNRGDLTVEQLWDLPLKGNLSLNSVAVALKKEITQTEDMIDLVDGDESDTSANVKVAKNKLRLEVVMHIIKVLKEERDASQAREATMSQLRAIDQAIASKQQEALVSGSLDELEKRRSELLNGKTV